MSMLKKLVIAATLLLTGYAGYIGLSLLSLPSVEQLNNRRTNMTIRVKDWKGKPHSFVVGPKNRYWTPSGNIPAEMKWAVILAEDANFYKHEGIDVKAIKNAIKHDLEKKTFARGASTITQQVAKNLFLSREKTISRKIKEIILAKRIEQELTKGRIIELYLNVVELGPMVYGIGHGSRYYFGKPASQLTPRECAFLAAMLPGPRVAYNPYKKLSKVIKRSDTILRLLRKKNVLSAAEYQAALAEMPNISRLQKKVDESIKKVEAFNVMTSASGPVMEDPEVEGPAPAVLDQESVQEAEPAIDEQGPPRPGGETAPATIPEHKQQVL